MQKCTIHTTFSVGGNVVLLNYYVLSSKGLGFAVNTSPSMCVIQSYHNWRTKDPKN